MAYWRLYYHLVWTTYRREPLIDSACEALIQQTLYGKAKELGILIHAVGNVEDHVHVVASIPPKLSIADCVGKFKGAGSHRVNQESRQRTFQWQGGYGALSLGERSLETVIAYVRNQREHHRTGRSLVAVYERCTEEEDGVGIAAEER
jgi:REP element-mobilizing transposase RayT